MIDTKDRILDRAEQLFAANGYSATSLRSIIAAAGVNLAAVHYHFHSKQELLDAVIRRRAEPINQQRLAMLEQCECAAGGTASLECILTALLEPPLRMAREPSSAAFVTLMGRILAESDAATMRRHFGVVFERFMRAIARAVPDLSGDELLLRAHFALGVMAQTLSGRAAIFGPVSEITTERLVAFLSGGFRAPVTATVGSNR